MFTAAELTTPKSREDWEASIYSTLSQLGITTTNWKPGATVRAIVTVVSLMLAALSTLISEVAQSAFLDYATGDWLTLVAANTYGVTRIEATYASGSVTIVNSGGAVYLLAAGDLILLNSTTGKTFRNTASLSIGAGATVTASVLATEAGSDSSSDAGAIDALETPLDGLTVSNPSALVGVDAETDAALRLRCRESLGALSPNGPSDAYAYFARASTRADGSAIGITRVREVKDGAGGLSVYVATPTGGVTGTMTDPATDLGAIHDSLQKNACPLCVTLTTASAITHTVNVVYSVYLYNDSGMTSAEVSSAIAANLATWFSERPIGGDVVGASGAVWREQIVAVIGSSAPQIFRVDVTSPVADVTILSTEVPVLGTVSSTVYQVAKGAL